MNVYGFTSMNGHQNGICSQVQFVSFLKANSFLQKLTLKKGGKKENDRDSFPENVYIHLTNENIYDRI